MKKWFFMVVFLVCFGFTTISAADYTYAPGAPRYSNEVVELATKVAKLKGKFFLEYENEQDLLETCSIIVKYCRYEEVFDKYDIASIIIKESKFNHLAYNKKERVLGLMQITKPKKWWKEELFWYTNPRCKDQNIKAGLVILKTFYKEHKTKRLAIKRYNGSSHAATKYAESIMAIKKQLRSIKV